MGKRTDLAIRVVPKLGMYGRWLCPGTVNVLGHHDDFLLSCFRHTNHGGVVG